MKTIIAGSRDITNKYILDDALVECPWNITEVVSGNARGVDRLGEDFANEIKLPLKIMRANWGAHGGAAGYIRNSDMADYAEALLAVWDGKSKGTKHMIDIAKRKNLKVYVYKTIGEISE